MSKRFTETKKWEKGWYQDLPPVLKCLWSYLCDHCDGAGVWEGNWRLASFQIGAPVDSESLQAFGERVEMLPGGKVWIVDYVAFQHGVLSPKCPPHRPIINLLGKHGLAGRLSHLLPNEPEGLAKGSNTLEGIGEGKGKGKEPDGGRGETADDDPQRDLSADELEAVVQRCFDSPRRLDADARTSLQQAEPVKASQAAELERFYAAPNDPENSLGRCKSPGGLVRRLTDQLAKAKDFCRRHRRPRAGANGHSPPPTPEQFADWKTSLPASSEWRDFTFETLPEVRQSECRRWIKNNRQPVAA